MKAVNNYLKNVMKSVSYATADVVADLAPNAKEFSSTNAEFAKMTYSALKNPAMAIRKSVDAIQQSKVYKALDYGARNLTEDLRTGNFYNKERKERDELALSGLDANWDDLTEFGIDENWEENLGKDSKSSSADNTITAGDMKIVQSIEGSNAALANSTVNAVLAASNNQIKAGRADTGVLYTQNERLFGGLHKDITVLGSTMQSIYNMQAAALGNIDKNMSNFFTQESKLSIERNAMLKEILEMQRNMYKSADTKEKEAASKRTGSRIRWSDINTNGMVNIDSYFGAVKKNINNQISSLGMSGFGEDSNMLAEFMVSPLEGAMKYVVNGIIPSTVKAAAKEFDQSLSGIFGNFIGELGNARSKNEDGILGMLAKFLGVSTSVNRNVDTSRYEKGPVPFDGLTRKAIIDVIPTHLRRIEAAITGNPEQTFDYSSGKWTTMRDLKSRRDQKRKETIKSGTSELMEAMNPAINKARKGIGDQNTLDSFNKAWEEFAEYLDKNNGRFNPNASASKNGIKAYEYPNLYKNYGIVKTIFNNFDLIQSQGPNGKTQTRHTKNSVRMKLSSNILSAKDAEDRWYRDIESNPINSFAAFYEANGFDKHGKYDKKGKFTPFNQLTSVKDKLGNTVFDYLQNINKELTWFRINAGNFGGGNGGRRKSSKGDRSSFTPIDSINLRNASMPANNTYQDSLLKNDRLRKSALDNIASGKAVDMRDFDVDQRAYILQLSNMISEGALDDYKNELKGYDDNSISAWMTKNVIKPSFKSQKDIQKAIDKADAEGKNTSDIKMDAKEEKFFNKIMKRISSGDTVLGGIMGASADAFTNLLYTADKAIYEMMYKTELKSGETDGKKYNGFMDAMVGKMSDKFKEIGDKFTEDIIEPFKERLGIDDSFKSRFKDGIINTGSRLWTSFKDANMQVYGPAYHEMMTALGMEQGETMAQKKRAANRKTIAQKVSKAQSAKNLLDDDLINILKDYGLNFADYGSLADAQNALMPLLYEDMYKQSNGLKEVATDKDKLKLALKHVATNPELMKKAGTTFGFKIKGSSNAEIMSDIETQIGNRFDSSDATRRMRQQMNSSRAGSGAASASAFYLDNLGFSGTIEEKQKMLKHLASVYGAKIKDVNKLDTDEKLNKAYLRLIEKHNAKGTSGKPFAGLTTLTKGEGLIGAGGMSIVPKTGVYNISSPTHIINTEDMHSITGGPRVSVQQALGKEKLAAKAAGFGVDSHADGTIKITNKGVDVDPKEFLSEAKKYIPEAAGGGLIGGLLSLVLGIAGGPLLGAAVGAGTSVISSSETLKTKLFGKMGADNKRDGNGVISKTVMDSVNKYFPDIAKYGLAGIIPGLITPLGPIGGLMVGSAFGFLKNNERFTTKYFGENGKLSISSKEKKIIQNMLPGALKGAGIGVVAGALFGGPFGVLGNAAMGSALGMMASTEDFKNFILGTEVNGERMGGMVGAFKDAMEPFTNSLKDAGKKLTDAFDKNVIDPLARFIKPAIHALPIAIGTLPRKLAERFEKSKIGKTIETRIKDIVSPAARFGSKLLKPATSLIGAGLSIPGRIVGRAGDNLRAYDIRHGDMVDMTQAEAVEFMDRTNRGKQVSKSLRISSKIGSGEKGALSVDEAKAARDALNRMNDTESSANKLLNNKNRELNNLLNNYKTADGKKLSRGQIKKILNTASKGDFAAVSDILQNMSLEGSREGMTKAEFNTFMEDGGLKKAISGAYDAQTRLSNIKNMGVGKASEEANKLLAEKLGIDDISKLDKKKRAELAALFTDQITHLEANPNKIVNKIENDNHDNIKNVATTLQDILKIMIAERSGDADAIKAAVDGANANLDLGIKHANQKYDSNIERAKSLMGEDEADKLTEEGEDKLSTGKYDKTAKKYGADGVNNSTAGMKNISKKFGIRRRSSVPTDIKDNFTKDAYETISKLDQYSLKTFAKFINNKYIKEAIKVGEYNITKEDINLLTSTTNAKKLISNCVLLNQIYYKSNGKEIYNNYKSLQEIYDIGLEEAGKLRDEYQVDFADPTVSIAGDVGRAMRSAWSEAGEARREIGKDIKAAHNKVKGWKGTAKTKAGEAIDAARGVHTDKWHQKHDTDETDVEQHGLGTMLLKGAFNVGKGILGLGGKAIKGAGSAIGSLFKKKNNGEASDGMMAGAAGAMGALFGAASSSKSPIIAGNTDEVDEKGDGRDVLPMGDGEYGLFRRDSSGNVEPDTSDSHTKTVLNKLTLKEKATEKLQNAQLKASEIISNTFDTSKIKESKGGKIGWLSLLLMGGLLWKSGIIQKLFNGLIKPVWTEHIKPWITDTAVPWLKGIWTDKVVPFFTDKVAPWVTGTVIPAVEEGFGRVIGTLITQLPQLIWNGIKGVFTVGATALDVATGNKYNAGGSTSVDSKEMSEKYGSDTQTEMYDENGKKLTYDDIANGNYKKIYNNQGVEGKVDDNGKVTFKDQSPRGLSYLTTTGNAAAHGFAKSMATGKMDLITKSSNAITKFLSKRKGLKGIVGKGAHALTGPVATAENAGIAARNGFINNAVESGVDRLLTKSGNLGAEAQEQLLNRMINGDGSKASEAIKKIADFTDNGLVGRTRDFIGKGFNALKEKAGGLQSNIKNTISKAFGKGAKETAENTAENITKETLENGVQEAVEKTVTKATTEAAKDMGEQTAKTAAKNATKDATKAASKNGGFLSKILTKAKDTIEKLLENSTVKKKLMNVAESLGQTATAKWLKGIKEGIQGIFDNAIEKGIKKVGADTCKKVLSKVLTIVFLVTDFVTGADQAESILGVKETSLLEEFVAGIINALCNFLIIPSIVPGTNWIARKIFGLFNKDLESRQEEATKEYEEYKEKTGSTWTKEEYLKRKNSVTGKIGGAVSDAGHAVVGGAKKIGSGIVNGAKTVGNGIAGGAKWAWNGITSLFGNAQGTTSLNALDSVTGNNNTIIGGISKFLLGGITGFVPNIINALTKIGNGDNLSKVMTRAKEGKISIFSKEYWTDKDDDVNDTSFTASIRRAFTTLTKVMNLPMLMVKNSLETLATDITNVSDVVTGNKNSSSTSNTTASTNGTTSATSKTTFLGKVKNVFTGAMNKIRNFFGFGKGTGEYKYGTGLYSKQIDPEVAGTRFNSSSDSEYQTIGDSGCGPAAAVNALESLYGRGGNAVVNAARFALNHGYKETDGGTRPEFFSDYFNSNGLGSQTSYSKSQIAKNISSGMPTVIMGRDAKGTSSSTPFGKTPHYVTVTGTDGKGNAIVQDPESRYDNQLYPINNLMRNTSLGVSAFGKSYSSKRYKSGFGKFGRGKWGRGKSTIVFIGDSRTEGMKEAVGSNSHIWSCKVGAGYSWFKSTGIPAVNSQINSNTAVVILMGVNDCDSTTVAKNYANLVNEKAKQWTSSGAEVYYVSVNPVDESKHPGVSNSTIETFNSTVKSALDSSVKWIDTYSGLKGNVVSPDGLHYNNDTYKKIYDTIVQTVASGTAASSSTLTSGSTSSSNTNGDSNENGKEANTIGGLFSQILLNSKAGQALAQLTGMSQNSSSSSSSDNGSTTSSTSSSNGGKFPTYQLNDAQIKGVANIIEHEQPGMSGMLAEASLMANQTDEGGDDKATVERLVAQATGGWFAHGRDRFYNPGSPSADAIKAAKAVMLNGKRTLPRYVDEHDCFSDIASVTTNGSSISKTDRSAYVAHQTKVHNNMGSTYTFYEFPNSEADPFGYIHDDLRTKWGEDHYDADTAVSGLGKNFKCKKSGKGRWGRGNAEKVWWYLKKMGLTDAGAAGMLGNIEAESGVNFGIAEKLLLNRLGNKYDDASYTAAVDNGTIDKNTFLHPMGGNTQYGYGLVQWTSPGRKEGLYDLVKSKGVSISDPGAQMEWLGTELTNSYSGVLSTLKSTNSVSDASTAVLSKFEVPSNWQSQTGSRAAKSEKYYNQLKGTQGEEITGSVLPGGSSSDSGSDSDASQASNTIFSMFSNILSNSKAGQALAQLIGTTTSSGSTSSGDSSSSSGSSTASGDAAKVVEIAKKEVGTKETPQNYVKYNDWFWGQGKGGPDLPWCAAFVSWVGNQAGVPTSIIPKDAYTVTAYQSLINNGGKVSNSEAKPGDIIYFTNNGSPSGIYHTGIVTNNDGSTINTVEGNSSDMVAERSYSTNSSKVLVARPKYANQGSTSSTTTTTTKTNKKKNSTASDAPDVSNTRGGNGVKPLSRFGQFKDSMYGKGTKKVRLLSKDGYTKVEQSAMDARLGNAIKTGSRKAVYNKNPMTGMGSGGTVAFGMGTTPDYSKLINAVINVLMTIADNTDKLNAIVSILNNKLGTNITADDVSNNTNSAKQSLRSKLSDSLSNTSSSLSKFNRYADDVGDSSISSIIAAMNAIASE